MHTQVDALFSQSQSTLDFLNISNLFISIYGLLNSGQSGFRSLHSTLTALLETNDSWCVNIGRDLLNDLKKDFDAIDHEIILKKLTKNGVDQDALKWF